MSEFFAFLSESSVLAFLLALLIVYCILGVSSSFFQYLTFRDLWKSGIEHCDAEKLAESIIKLKEKGAKDEDPFDTRGH